MTLREAAEILRAAGVENPTGDAGLLLTEICGVPRASLPFSADVEYDSPEFESAIRRRAKREPLQYILGKWWFRDSRKRRCWWSLRWRRSPKGAESSTFAPAPDAWVCPSCVNAPT